ncbi:MAG: hypothetical protein COX77_01705 [Candidatus Komeilibacteria bacterium CG_4_10_14_0_2_um_filter_37_10]|uniref:Uncharacterized protein n=1 Tax=Candidatus Komeilibacteria bacterium CG_4_10_14_0_2_um_filter_37_10 TaxID=1974470 RepID=A0A2M7VFJ4_9BACT|nr:MAG: hypothetical protein COX77_01705 [Candidatus Komeilibacteria bacterium CG_4_10_14_0_2_um_filter_37_10]PJA92538.1 MAG: hypothetical protein CO133_02635 [Candidatus Komeilibacteria bacterium CG_4_9_14_3_um_filter_37_5]
MLNKKYTVKVITRASQNKVVELVNGSLRVYLTAVPVDNKANDSLIKILAQHWSINKSKISILSGSKSHNKVIVVG